MPESIWTFRPLASVVFIHLLDSFTWLPYQMSAPDKHWFVRLTVSHLRSHVLVILSWMKTTWPVMRWVFSEWTETHFRLIIIAVLLKNPCSNQLKRLLNACTVFNTETRMNQVHLSLRSFLINSVQTTSPLQKVVCVVRTGLSLVITRTRSLCFVDKIACLSRNKEHVVRHDQLTNVL